MISRSFTDYTFAGELYTSTGYIEKRKRAELTSALGAGVLGAGIGLFFSQVLSPYAMGFLVVGLLSHSWGMYEKHRLDSSMNSASPSWVTWAYWICWLLLAGLASYVAWGIIN